MRPGFQVTKEGVEWEVEYSTPQRKFITYKNKCKPTCISFVIYTCNSLSEKIQFGNRTLSFYQQFPLRKVFPACRLVTRIFFRSFLLAIKPDKLLLTYIYVLANPLMKRPISGALDELLPRYIFGHEPRCYDITPILRCFTLRSLSKSYSVFSLIFTLFTV